MKGQIIQIERVSLGHMALKYVELYPKSQNDWRHFGIENIYPETSDEEMSYGSYFKVVDKKKFVWAMMFCGVDYIICNNLECSL